MNYQKELDQIIENMDPSKGPLKLLIHSCCAPCSSYVLEYLSNYFAITVFYYNPNIYPEKEYSRRVEEQKNLINAMKYKYPVRFEQGVYNPKEYYQFIKGYEREPEGGKRCFLCYEMRLREAGEMAKEGRYDYFTTTLSISPHKNAEKLNEIGKKVAAEYGVEYLPSDFKKKNGYKRSIELSKDYGLYRQDYCGCIYSQRQQKQDETETN
ncbi:epoxyqueuosine reductase QueH [Mobilitalea sibirica]|uniref:Epoxyqueuosine reductase QueH n=1 Tax=Mobilitalea sibirica TaxID=1462919 RepID=A0A8J7H5T4_9FIRM|nr:epoxyqueuosine reductase QueH [Mobilitalea sibirica]MBH1940351.1 epoxyqueuosine reductase QueH [Mobilitalea sibirica]